MWIRTQNKGVLINPNNIISIFTDSLTPACRTRNKCTIYASSTTNTRIILGEYENEETAKNILEGLFIAMDNNVVSYITMPEDNKESVEAFDKLTTDLVSLSITHKFIK